MSFSFVILHYNVIEETIKCINSILSLCDAKDYSIIVVDNHSPNGTGKQLEENYKNNSKIHIILSKENLGFAKGNNIGINYAKNTIHADFVIVLNNDTYMVQNNFCSIILKEWEHSHFAVLGPYVHTLSGENQNPVAHEITTISDVNFWIKHHQKGLIRTYLGIDSIWIGLKDFIKKIIHYKDPTKVKNEKKQNTRQENVKLHGCCFIFSPTFFEHFDGFDPRTFMYAEEDILLAHIRKKKLLTVYNPKLEIFHAERSATKSVTKTSRQKKIFIYKEGIKALNVLKKVLEE